MRGRRWEGVFTGRANLMSENEISQDMIDAYADGELTEDQLSKLVEIVDSSQDVRERLALTVVSQRLLIALGRGPVSSRQIMDAVASRAAESAKPRHRAGQKRVSGREYHPAVAGGILLVFVALAAGLFWKIGKNDGSSDAPELKRGDSVQRSGMLDRSRDSPAGAERERLLSGIQSSPAFEGGEDLTVPTVARRVPSHVSGGLPLAIPEVQGIEDLRAPSTDGSDEPGFVPPSRSWPAPQESSDDKPVPVPPVLWVKTGLGDDVVATQGDVDALMNTVNKRLRLSYSASRRHIGELRDDPSENPVLYFSGHHHFSFTPYQRGVLRRLVLSGGMMIFNSALGSRPFYDSAHRELRLILPEIRLRRLAADHPLYHSYYDIRKVSHSEGVRRAGYASEEPWLEGITISCRTAVVVSRWGLSSGWVGHSEKDACIVDAENAKRLGINLFSYATAVRAWAKRSSHTSRFSDAGKSGGRMFVAQVMYGGAWKTRYEALSVLLHTFNRLTDVPVRLRTRSMRLTDGDVFSAPMLYLTGHDPVVLTKDEMDRLRSYIESGGFLLAEACCGRKGFDRSFRGVMKQTFPEHDLTVIPGDSSLFRIPNRIELLGVTPSLGEKSGSMLMAPRLEGIKLGDNYAVVYSPYGLAGGWEMSQVPYADGYEDPDAIKLGQNILMYAITQ